MERVLMVLTLLMVPSSLASLEDAVGETNHGCLLALDMGGTWMKAASTYDGKVELVLNEQTSRKTPAFVAINDGLINVGESALLQRPKRPNVVLGHTSSLLGQMYHSAAVADVLRNEPYELSEDSLRGTTVYSVPQEDWGNEDGEVSPEEVAAHAMAHLAQLAGPCANDTKVVIAVPPWYTTGNRQAVIDAAHLAGLRVISLINSNVAAAVNYATAAGVTAPAESPHIALLYDMGSTSTTATVVALSTAVVGPRRGFREVLARQVEILATATDSSLGGDDFDRCLAGVLLKEFPHAKDVMENPNARLRLLQAAEKAKRVLSVNSKIPVQVSDLFAGTDLRTLVSRDAFERACGPLFARATAPVERAVAAANVTLAHVHALVPLGGASRMPRLQEEVTRLVGRPFEPLVNAEEATVLGAGFVAGTLENPNAPHNGYRIKDMSEYSFPLGPPFPAEEVFPVEHVGQGAAYGGFISSLDAFRPFNRTAAKERFDGRVARDAETRARHKARNDLETFMYRARELVSDQEDEDVDAGKEGARGASHAAVRALLEEAEEWVWDHDDAVAGLTTAAEYHERLARLSAACQAHGVAPTV